MLKKLQRAGSLRKRSDEGTARPPPTASLARPAGTNGRLNNEDDGGNTVHTTSDAPPTAGPSRLRESTADEHDDHLEQGARRRRSPMLGSANQAVRGMSNSSKHAVTAAPTRDTVLTSSPVSLTSSPVPALRIDESKEWCLPEDAEGAYVRQTYAHFDKQGIRGDGLVDGKEWTREKSPKPAWVVAAEEGEERNRRRSSSRRSSTLPTSPVLDKMSDASLSSSTATASQRNGHLSPPYVTPRHSLSSLTQQTASLDLATPDGTPDISADTNGQLSAAQSSNAISSNTSSVGSDVDDNDQSVDVNGRPLLASESDSAIDAERSHMLLKIDRYGFFPRMDDEGARSRNVIVVLPTAALKKVPKRRIFGRRNARNSRRDSDTSQILSMRRFSAGREDDGELKAGSFRTPTLRQVLSRRRALDDRAREREATRVTKWDRMLVIRRDMTSEKPIYRVRENLRKSHKLRRRVFKGVPDRWRAAVWAAMELDNGIETRADGGESFSFEALQEQSSPYDVQIDLDVPRTISGHILFHTRYGQGQRALFHVLHAFSLICKDCAYCQGMGPIAATLLVYFSPERAFDVMVTLHDKDIYGLHKTFSPGFPGLVENIYVQRQLCEMLCPDVLAALDAYDIAASAYATKWYITLFTNVVPFSTQLRLWDAYFYLGRDVLVVAATAILWSLRTQLLDADFEGCMYTLSREFVPEDDDVLLHWIFAVMERDETRKCLSDARRAYIKLAQNGTVPVL